MRGLTDNLSVIRGLTENLSVRSCQTYNLSVRKPLTENLSVRRGLTVNLSVTGNLSRKGSQEGFLDKQITSMEMNAAVMNREATKHCSWGLCKLGSRYPESMPEGTHFFRFAKVRKVKDRITEKEKNKQNELTEKAKKLVHKCGRKGFTIDRITKDRYICLLPFVSRNGSTEEDPDPVNASLLECRLMRPFVSQEES